MDNMVLEEKKVKNICNFYVSDYHLEIMLLPYISKKIDNEENITIITEIDLESTLNVVIERINLDKDKKEKIKFSAVWDGCRIGWMWDSRGKYEFKLKKLKKKLL